MKKSIVVMAVTLAAAAITGPAYAQMDWLGPYTESNMIWSNQRVVWENGSKTSQRKTKKTKPKRKIVRYPEVEVNGQALEASLAPAEINGHTFVPMRSLFEALGFTVTHDSKKHLITARRGDSVMQIGLPGGAGTTLGMQRSFEEGDTPFIHKGVMMLPLRKVSETIGAKVTYTSRPKTPLISITYKPK